MVGTEAPRWENLAELNFDHLNRQSGLPHDYILAVAQDRAGFLWIGTQDGLARYDGYRFKTYRFDPASPDSLPSNFILALLLDHAGYLWVGTQSGGLARYDAERDAFIRVPVGPSELSSPEVRALTDAAGGGVWVGTLNGLIHLDEAGHVLQTFRHSGTDPASLPDDKISAVLLGRDGAIWVGTGAGLARLTTDGAGFVTLRGKTPAERKALDSSITSLFQDHRGRIWVGTFDSGAVTVDPTTGVVEMVPEPPGGLHGADIKAIREIRPGTIWLGTDGSGLEAIDIETGRSRLLRHNAMVQSSIGEDHVSAIFRDQAGLVWLGTGSALDRYDPSTEAVATLYGGPGHPDGISDPEVTAVAVARSGLVWLGLGEQGVDILDPRTQRVGALRPDPAAAERALPSGSVNSLLIAPDDSAWIGTDHGLYHADAGGTAIRLVRLEATRPTPFVRSLFLSGDALWIGTENGLLRYRIDRKEIRVYPADPDGTAGLTDGRIMVILPAGDGRLWIGTERGLNLLDPETGAVERMLPDIRDQASLSHGIISTLTTDPAGRLWVGSAGGGIDILDARDDTGRPRFRHLGTRDGLPDTLVDAFLSDADRRIWASTDNRLAAIDPVTLTIRPFQIAEGVRIPTYWQQSAATTPQGDLLFGGSGGLTVVQPARFHEAPFVPPIVVTDARIGDRVVPVAPLNRRESPSSITLVPGDRGFQVEFAGLDLAAPDRERYAYRLDGFDPDWIEAPQRVATYTNLPPGRYGLRLRVQDREASWVEGSLPVIVQPTIVQTIWFRMIAVASGIILVSLLVQLRTSSLQRRRAELQLLVDQQTTELIQANQRLEELATTDGLTGVLNRRRFMELAVQEIERARRRGHPLSIALADLDKFKSINDTLGHLAGDVVLRATAVRFLGACRRIDTLARYGGEEFIILMPETRLDAASAAAERLRESIAELPVLIETSEISVTISIGVAQWAGAAESLERLIDRADKALYSAKARGRNRVEIAPAALT